MRKIEVLLLVSVFSIVPSTNVLAVSLEPSIIQSDTVPENQEADEMGAIDWEETDWENEETLSNKETEDTDESTEEILPEEIEEEIEEDEVLPKTGVDDVITIITEKIGDMFYNTIKFLIGRG